jgi:thiamine biosynthesis lipoprotein
VTSEPRHDLVKSFSRLHLGAFALVGAAVVGGGLRVALPATVSEASPNGTRDGVRLVAYSRRTMGTLGTVTVATADSSASAPVAACALAAFARVDSLMSNWTDDSEVARINREAGRHPVEVHPEVLPVLRFSLDVAAESDGAFDVTVEPLVRLWGFLGGKPHVPAEADIERARARMGYRRVSLAPEGDALRFTDDGVRIDLGGVAKGRAVDLARAALTARGVECALVDLSGNMAALGHPPGRDAWVVGIRDPSDEVPYFARLTLGEDAIATSGDYEQFVDANGHRYGHILDPRTGWPASGLVSVTVLAPSAMAADAWATAFFVLGADSARRVAARRDDLDVVLVRSPENGIFEVWVESRLAPRFELQKGQADRFVVHVF